MCGNIYVDLAFVPLPACVCGILWTLLIISIIDLKLFVQYIPIRT